MHETIQAWLAVHYNKSRNVASGWDMEYHFREQMKEQFKKDMFDLPDGTKYQPCDKATFIEYYLDGLAILEHVKDYRNDFFPNSNHELVGCEIPLERRLNDHLAFIGYIDIVVRDKSNGRIMIYDLKTSKKGWYDYQRKDPKKLNQILLYKKFYADLFNIDAEDVEVQFLILKRKIDENSQWAQKRISKFEPANGTRAVKNAWAAFEAFITNAFDDDGQVRVENLTPTPSKSACMFCPFKSKVDICPDSYYKDQLN